MELSPRETNLLDAFRRLPAEAGDEIAALVQRMAERQPGVRIDWSDEWTDDDLRDFTAASASLIDRAEAS